MNNEKLDNLLNMALNATASEREKSRVLDVGFDHSKDTWQLIVKSSDGLDAIRKAISDPDDALFGIEVRPLLNGYAILSVPQDAIDTLSERPEIEYIEKPKRLLYSIRNGRTASCVTPLQTPGFSPVTGKDGPQSLFGKNILIAVIDSGIDYAHPDFCREDGSTRIAELWDQELGRIFTDTQINLALSQSSLSAREQIVPSRDLSGHGTHVAGICAGNGRASDGLYRGIASESTLLIVKLKNAGSDTYARTTGLMAAVDYVLRKARERRLPVAVNLSLGTNDGSHDGTSLVETYLSAVSSYWKSVIVTGTGNEGASRTHAAEKLPPGTFYTGRSADSVTIPFSVGNFEPALTLQIWKSYTDIFEIRIRFPDGTLSAPLGPSVPVQRLHSSGTSLLVYYGSPRPYSTSQEICIDFLPEGSYLTSGLWEIILLPREIVDGTCDLWLPGAASLSSGTGFLYPSEETTLTIPSTASKVISAGAYDPVFNNYASFSGRGYTRGARQIKPDLAAPGVNIISCAPGGGYTAKSGTSMAAPFVTGAAALLMEWGIALGRDPYLYGEKVKAYLKRGAKRNLAVPGSSAPVFPNPFAGWGTLCLSESFPSE